MLLDKTSEKILKQTILKYSGNMEKDILIFPKELNIDYTELNYACANLKKLGYLNLFMYSYFNDEDVTVQLSHNGLHYFEMKNKNFFYICLKSIWMPLTVSLSTNIAVYVCKWLLKLIQ